MKKIFMLFVLIALATPVLATDWYGEGAIGVDVKSVDVDDTAKRYDMSTSLKYLGLGADNERFSFYGTLDNSGEASEFNSEVASEFTIKEMYAKFNLFDTDFNVGKVFVPMGVNMKFDRPLESVFISSPRTSLYMNGITSKVYDGFISLDGFFSGVDTDADTNDEFETFWTMRAEMQFMNGGLVPSVTYVSNSAGHAFDLSQKFMGHVLRLNEDGSRTRSLDLDPQVDLLFDRAEMILACEVLYESLMFNASVMGEFWLHQNYVWVRGVITPGVFDRVAVFGGYYNAAYNDELPDEVPYEHEHAITYGASFEVNEGVEVSTEWITQWRPDPDVERMYDTPDDSKNVLTLQVSAKF